MRLALNVSFLSFKGKVIKAKTTIMVPEVRSKKQKKNDANTKNLAVSAPDMFFNVPNILTGFTFAESSCNNKLCI